MLVLYNVYVSIKKHRDKFLEAILIRLCTYRARGIFAVTTIGANKVFGSIRSKLQDNLYQITLITYNLDRHVEVIERMVRFVKEQIRVVHLDMA